MSGEYALSLDGSLIADAQRYYAEYGYVDTATPWLVGELAYRATLPPEHDDFVWQAPNSLYHVASAEQGFIQLMVDGKVIPKKAQSATPCFRGEPNYDSQHWPYFYKLELYSAETSDTALAEMVTCARGLFTRLGIETRVVSTGERMCDIETIDGVELGSYGERLFMGHRWLYGTGLALPRAHLSAAGQDVSA